ncbi:MAG TPA: hypothetical protein EYG60_04420 [Campylobacterales bacterium]|nr:hypothetical protein [Campylobacterales bacterium]
MWRWPLLNPKRVIFAIIGGLLGFLIGKLSKSLEIILIATPLGAWLGYGFGEVIYPIVPLFFKFLWQIITIWKK